MAVATIYCSMCFSSYHSCDCLEVSVHSSIAILYHYLIVTSFATKFIQATPSIKLHDILVRTIMRYVPFIASYKRITC